ncbi:MAG: hypothetical protein AAGU11_01110, partial [Syntrophobacteraceae bacterium]
PGDAQSLYSIEIHIMKRSRKVLFSGSGASVVQWVCAYIRGRKTCKPPVEDRRDGLASVPHLYLSSCRPREIDDPSDAPLITRSGPGLRPVFLPIRGQNSL